MIVTQSLAVLRIVGSISTMQMAPAGLRLMKVIGNVFLKVGRYHLFRTGIS